MTLHSDVQVACLQGQAYKSVCAYREGSSSGLRQQHAALPALCTAKCCNRGVAAGPRIYLVVLFTMRCRADPTGSRSAQAHVQRCLVTLWYLAQVPPISHPARQQAHSGRDTVPIMRARLQALAFYQPGYQSGI